MLEHRAAPLNAIDRGLLMAAGVAGLLGVLAGTFGAHGLKGRIAASMLENFETGVRYHLIHGVALLAIAMLTPLVPGSRLLRASGWCMVIGIAIFSGSLYAMALSGKTWLGMVTPFGGVSLMLGWLLLTIAAFGPGSRDSGRPQ